MSRVEWCHLPFDKLRALSQPKRRMFYELRVFEALPDLRGLPKESPYEWDGTGSVRKIVLK